MDTTPEQQEACVTPEQELFLAQMEVKILKAELLAIRAELQKYKDALSKERSKRLDL